MSKFETVSASQIELFRKCPRKWVEKYILKNSEPTTPAMEEGLEVHKAIETFLKTGQMPESRWKRVLEKLETTLKDLDLA